MEEVIDKYNENDDKYYHKTTDLLKVIIGIFLVIFWSSMLIYTYFSFELTIIYCISLSVSIIFTWIVWIENVIIRKGGPGPPRGGGGGVVGVAVEMIELNT